MSGAFGAPARTLVISCADWPALAVGREPGHPVAVLHANRVVAASPGARAVGVVPGLRRREAQGRCPEVEIAPVDPLRDARAFESVVRAAEAVCPRVELTEAGRLTFPTRGPSRYFGGDPALARRVWNAVADARPGLVGLYGVGVADGPFAAELAAVAARRRGEPLLVPRGSSPRFLEPQPIGVLTSRVPGGRELVDLLSRLGVRTLGAFAALPPADVTDRLGAAGVLAHRLARGEDARPPEVAEPPPDLVTAESYDPPLERVDAAAFSSKVLADELHLQLESRGLACTRLLVVVVTEPDERGESRRIERLWRHEGALDATAIAQRVRWQLEGWLGTGWSTSRRVGGVARIELVPDEVVPADGRQLGFWGGADGATERARRALARVQGLLGEDAVVTPRPTAGRGPGEADPTDAAPWPGRLPAPHPALVEVHPRPAEVVDDAGRRVGVSGRGMVSAPPARIATEGGPWRAVRAWAGPWPVEERWWDPLSHRRAARFQLLLEDDAALLCSVADGRWWVEARYD